MAENFTDLIAKKLRVSVDDIPLVVDKYTVSKGIMRISQPDLNTFNELFKVTPNAGVGNGEVALYWLYNWQSKPSNPMRPGKAFETRGKFDPDLNINRRKVEVKATGDHNTIGLGRFGRQSEFISMVESILGVYNFIEGKSIDAQASLTKLKYEDLVEAAEVFCEFRQLLFSSKRLQEYRVFQKALNVMKSFDNLARQEGLKNICYIGPNRRQGGEQIAAEISKYILSKQLGEKPGDKGYLTNLFTVGSGSAIKYDNVKGIMFHYIDLDNMATDPQTLGGSPKGFSFEGGKLSVNFTKLFS